MDEEKNSENIGAEESPEDSNEAPEDKKNETPQDPLKTELERVKFTKKERLEYAKKKIEKQLAEIGGDEEDRPLTLKEYRELEAKKATKTALELAERIEDESEKELVKHYLKNRIVPSGKPEEDLSLARAAVNSLRNAQIAEETQRAQDPVKRSAPGAPAQKSVQFQPTPEEAIFMAPPYNLTKEDIIKARAKGD